MVYPPVQLLTLLFLNSSVNLNNNAEITSAKDLQTFYPDRFKGIGKFPNKCHLTLKEDAHPIKHPPRKAPILLQERSKEELKRMEDLEVIRKVSENTDWISSITYVHKANGALRISLDPKDLNQNLKRGQHHIPTMEELGHKFAEATVFIELDTESQLLTTFNTPYGRYCFQRLPFGLNVSQDIFQAAMDENLEGLEGVISITDDIVVFGKDEAEHDRNLHAQMIRARERGMVFNSDKCKIPANEIFILW